MNEHEAGDMVGAYVLDALEPQEQAAFEEHLAGCSACLAEVTRLRQVVDVLPLSVEQVEPPASLKERVVAGIREQPARDLTVLPGGAPRRRRTTWLTGRDGLLGLVAAVLIVAAGVLGYQIHNQSGNQQNPAQTAMLDAIAHGAKLARVSGTAVAPAAAALVVQPKNGSRAYFAVKGLPASQANRVYQIWLLRGNAPYSVAVFTYSGNGWQYLELPRSTRGYPLTAVTNEPGPNGSRAPTTKPVLAGKLGGA